MRAPIARFVGVVATLGLVLVLAAWTGATAPGLRAQEVGEGTQDDGRTGYLLAQIDNPGTLPVAIGAIRWTSPGLTGEQVLIGPLDGAPDGAAPFEPFTLDGGQQVAVLLRGAISCPLPGDVVTVTADNVVVEAKPVAGPARQLTLELGGSRAGMERTLPCPPR